MPPPQRLLEAGGDGHPRRLQARGARQGCAPRAARSVGSAALRRPSSPRAGTQTIAKTASGAVIAGKLLSAYSANADTLRFQYPVTCETTAMCQEGGLNQNYVTDALVTNGCISTDHPITIGGVDYAITNVYNGQAGRTIQGFSTSAKVKQYDMGHTTYLKYYNYYGMFTYADEWVTAALEGRNTAFPNKGKNRAAAFRLGRPRWLNRQRGAHQFRAHILNDAFDSALLRAATSLSV